MDWLICLVPLLFFPTPLRRSQGIVGSEASEEEPSTQEGGLSGDNLQLTELEVERKSLAFQFLSPVAASFLCALYFPLCLRWSVNLDEIALSYPEQFGF